MKKFLFLLVGVALFIGCDDDEDENTFVNGIYNAEEAAFGYNWKGFMELEINGDDIVTVNFDYINEEDNTLLKSETTVESYPMDPHPTVWVPELKTQLMASDIENYTDVDGITGATHSSATANVMMRALLEAAKTGDTSKQIISEE